MRAVPGQQLLPLVRAESQPTFFIAACKLQQLAKEQPPLPRISVQDMTYGFLTYTNGTFFIKRVGQQDYAFTDAIRPCDTAPTVLEMLMCELCAQCGWRGWEGG
jgi:hypothetical protein